MIDTTPPVNPNRPVAPRDSGPVPPVPRNPIARLCRSLRYRGVGHTLRMGMRHLSDALARRADVGFDRRLGTDTSTFVEIADMHDVESPNRERGIRYEPTLAEPFRRVMSAAAVPVDGTFLDVGAGKGRVLMLAAEAGFTRVLGVDFSPSLCEIARRNLERYAAGARGFSWEVVCADAAGYPVANDVRVVYMYNPFDEVVMRAFLDGLDASLAADPRPLWLIYHNAVWHAQVVARGFDVVLERSYGGRDFTVYRRATAA